MLWAVVTVKVVYFVYILYRTTAIEVVVEEENEEGVRRRKMSRAQVC